MLKILTFDALSKGHVAEWLGRGLQNLVQRFESARDLRKPQQNIPVSLRFFFVPISYTI